MGAIRIIFAIIFILYGLTQAVNGAFIILGMDQPLTLNPQGTAEADAIVSQIIPLQLFGFITVGWGLLWIWIGNRVRKGGQQNE